MCVRYIEPFYRLAAGLVSKSQKEPFIHSVLFSVFTVRTVYTLKKALCGSRSVLVGGLVSKNLLVGH